MSRYIVYIGDFDLRNENVQAHLVRNNGKILNSLDFDVEYIGINRNESSFRTVDSFPPLRFDDSNYLELPYTLSISGLHKVPEICRRIIDRLDTISKKHGISYVITYQSPTYAVAIKRIAAWCKKRKVPYLVNCADLPTFELQSPVKKAVMKMNWAYLHKVNKKYADGIIAVSRYIDDFYKKPNRESVIIPPLFGTDDIDLTTLENDIPTFIYAGTPFVITHREATPGGMKDRLDKVIDLFLLLSDAGVNYRFRIVGIEKNDYLDGVPRHAAALSDETRIEFCGRMSHGETLQAVSQADFSINYRDENLMTKAGFSTKIVESVSVGTPVIINPISDTFLYLKDGKDGFSLSGDVDKDIRKLKSLCSMSRGERSAMKQKLFNKKIFDVSKYKNVMDCFLHSVATEEGKELKNDKKNKQK